MVRRRGSELSVKTRMLVSSSMPSRCSSARALIMASPSSVASFFMICCLISTFSLLARSHPTAKNFPTCATWKRAFCLGIRNVHSRKPSSSSVCGRVRAVDCGARVPTSFSPVTLSCEYLHRSPQEQPFGVPRYWHGSR